MKKRAWVLPLATIVVFSAAACGPSVDTAVDATGAGAGAGSTTTTTTGASGAGGSVIDAGTIDPDPSPDAGCFGTTPLPPHPPSPETCTCGFTKGFVIDGGCGSVSLPAPFYASEYPPFCEVDRAFYTVYECKGNFSHTFSACVANDTAPCISLTRNHFSGADSLEGTFIDGAGETYSLSDIVFESNDSPPSVVSGSFKALATSKSGKTMSLSGTFEVCQGSAVICPI